MPKFDDLTDRTFEKLYVIGRAPDYVTPKGHHDSRWLCKCECGNEVTVRRTNLVTNHTKSCGCIRNKSKKKRVEKRHGSRCIHNREGVICEDQNCSECGWNPCNTKLKRQRLKNLNERMRENE